MTQSITLRSTDGIVLEGELEVPDAPRAAVVLCHPHPEHGGTMRSVVISALFEHLPPRGIACLRFNFRGVEGSGGSHEGGVGERHDATAALAALADTVGSTCPITIAGWSFGADVALGVRDDRHRGWMAIAPPLASTGDLADTASDARPKLFALAEHDQFRGPSEVEGVVADWEATETHIVGGADHFFIGRTDQLVELTASFALDRSGAREREA